MSAEPEDKPTTWNDPRQPELGLRLVQNQEKQIELDTKRLKYETQMADQGYAFSREALKAEVEDRKDTRKRRNHALFVIGGLSLVAILTLAILNKDQLLLDLAKIGAGIALGYGLKSSQASKRTAENPDL